MAGVDRSDQEVLIENIKSSQLSRFVGKVNSSNVVNELMSKKGVTVDLESKRLNCYKHGLNIGDKILFDSPGFLPDPFLKGLEYTVRQVFEHSFLVAISEGQDTLNVDPLTLGRDQVGNEGGLHYFINQNLESTTEELKNIALGAPWAMSNNQLLEQKGGDCLLDRKGINSVVGATEQPVSLDAPDWFYSEIFKESFHSPEDTGGWLQMASWGSIFILENVEMNDDGTVDTNKEGFYYYHATLGWVFYWRASDIHQVTTSHVEGLENTYFKILDKKLIFAWENSEFSTSKFCNVTGGIIAEQVYTGESPDTNGFYLKYGANDYWSIWNFSTAYPVNPLSLTQGSPVAWGTQSKDIYNMGNFSLKYKNADGSHMPVISIKALDHSIGNSGYLKIEIDNWAGNGIYLAKYLESTSDATVNGTVMLDNYLLVGAPSLEGGLPAGAKFIEMDKKLETVPLFSQKFRIKSIKEADRGIYEVSASEYNPLKFKAIENNINVERPRAYIPPQADMTIPEAPENLHLIDITFRPD